MSHEVAFIPAVSEAPDRQDLVYAEESSRARGLHVLMQDASPRAGGARRQFLLACFRDTVSRYLAADRLVSAATFLRETVIAFDAIARGVDTRLDDVEGLGIFVVLREPASLYVLCARGASTRVRWRGVFVPLSTPQLDGVTELSIETARSQHDLFAQTLPETLALYRVAPAPGETGVRELLFGGTVQDMGAAVDTVEEPRVDDARRVPVDRIRNTVLMLALNAVAVADSVAPAERREHRPRVHWPHTRTWVAAGAVLVLVAAGLAGVHSWQSEADHGGDDAAIDHTALKETPAPPPPEKRVMEDLAAEEEHAAETTRRGFGLAWQQSFRAAVTSSPAVAGDAVVFGGRDGRVYSIARASGERQWAYAAQGGVGASPVVHGATVIAADYSGNVVRLRAGNGDLVWKRALREKIVSTPAVTDERVVVGTVNGRVYALSLESGRVLWKFSARGPIRGAIVHAGETFLVPSHDGRLYAVAEDTGARRWAVPLGGPVAASPASDREVVVVGTAKGDVLALDLASGKERWRYRTGGAVNSSLALEGGRAYAGAADRRLYCIDAANGQLLWRVDTGGAVLSRPFVDDGRVVATSYDGAIYCIDDASGDVIDRYETDESIFSSPAVVDGRVFFGNNAGHFYCLDLPRS